MPGVAELVWLIYQNSGPAMTAFLIIGGSVVYVLDIRPRLNSVEDRADTHEDRLDQGRVSMAERDILLDNAHGRIDDVEDDVEQAEEARHNLRNRIADLESQFSAEHGRTPGNAGGTD